MKIKTWIVSTYQLLLTIVVWMSLIAGAVVGWTFAAGGGAGFMGKVLSAALGTGAFFLFTAVMCGALFTLGDIRDSIRVIEKSKNEAGS